MQFRDDLHVEEAYQLTLAEPTRLRVRLASTTPARSGDLLRQCAQHSRSPQLPRRVDTTPGCAPGYLDKITF
jgi:hypothetical protein